MTTASGRPTKAQVAPHLCQWWWACTNTATHLSRHPACPDGIPTCDEHEQDIPAGF